MSGKGKVVKGARGEYVFEGYVDLETEVVLDKEGRRIDQAYLDRLVQAADEAHAKRAMERG